MTIQRRTLLATGAASVLLPAVARSQTPTLRIGVLNDLSGTYRDDTGPTGVACARQALVDFGVAAKNMNVEVLMADHQNKPDIGAGIVRQWFDRDGVDAVVDVPTSSVGLAVSTICREKNKVHLNSGSGTSDLTGSQCSPNTVQWTYDSYMQAETVVGGMTRAGGDTYFFIVADYTFGQNLLRDAITVLTPLGGKVLGKVAYPFPETTDFSSMIVRAQASGAKVLCLANAGDDTANCIKQAQEFGVLDTMKLAAMQLQTTVIHSMGLEILQGPALRHQLLLGSQRPHPRLQRPHEGQDAERHLAEHDPGRRLRGHAALPEGRRRDGHCRRQGGRPRRGREDEGDADRR